MNTTRPQVDAELISSHNGQITDGVWIHSRANLAATLRSFRRNSTSFSARTIYSPNGNNWRAYRFSRPGSATVRVNVFPCHWA